MKGKGSLSPSSRLDITRKWVDRQIYLITCYPARVLHMNGSDAKFLREVLRLCKADPLKWPFAKAPGWLRILAGRAHPLARVRGVRGSGTHPKAEGP
jgi:hypothetical protein